MPPLYTSYFTPNYAGHAASLIASLDALSLPHDVRPVGPFASWQAATHHKPAHLLGMRGQYPGRPLVWLDADARVLRKPELFDSLDADFAAYWHHGEELFSGTLYFGATDAATQLLKAWAAGCAATPAVIDQRVLQRVAEAMPDVRVVRLPKTYCFVADFMHSPDAEPVIAQGMASRERK
jgi:hypothetical protein